MSHHHKNSITPSKMDFRCESFQKYQYMPLRGFSSFVVEEFDFILGILNEGKRIRRSVLTNTETVQRVYNLACILWQSQGSFSSMAEILNDDMHNALLNWTLNTPPNVKCNRLIKVAIDRLLSSIYSIKPDLYDGILTRLNIINDTQSSLNPHIFRHVVPDDIEVGGYLEHASAPIDLRSMDLTENMFKTLSVVSLSCIPAHKLIHSKFLLVLIDLIIDFITKDKHLRTTPELPSAVVVVGNEDQNSQALQPNVPATRRRNIQAANDTDGSSKINVDSLSLILDFFANLCWQNILRTWLCSAKNTVLWEHILQYLCFEVPKSKRGNRYMLPGNVSAKSIHKLEESAINFFSKCCVGHFQNQKKFATVFSQVLQQGVLEGAPSGLSDFTRRVVLEFIISPGFIYVSIETDLPKGVNQFKTDDVDLLLPPPAFPASKQHQLLYVSVDSLCTDILRKVIIANGEWEILDNDSNNNLDIQLTPNTRSKNNVPSTSKQSSIGSPNPGSGKRSLDDTFTPSAKRTKISHDERAYKLMFWAPDMGQFMNISQHWSIAEIMQIFVPSGDELEVPFLKFFLSREDSNDNNEETPKIQYLAPPPAIQRFLDVDGFEFIALNAEKKLAQAFPSKLTKKNLKQMPIRTVMAFGQLLRLSDYQNNPETKLVLQSIIGSDKKTNLNSKILSQFFAQDSLKVCNPLTVLPFELLRLTFSRSYKNGADFNSLDRFNAPAIDFVLMNLAVLTHQPEKEDCHVIPENKIYLEALRQCYSTRNRSQKQDHECLLESNRPQGVGYSTDADQFVGSLDLSRIVEEEELITVLLVVLGHYICPDPILNSPFKKYEPSVTCDKQLMRSLPSATVEQIRKSCLLQILTSYLKNDSVFDVVKHIPLYKAILFVVRAIIFNVQLAPLILNVSDCDGETAGSSDKEQQSITNLITKLKMQIQEFLRKTKRNQPSTSSSSTSHDDTNDEETTLFEDILNTAGIIEIIQSNTVASVNAPTTSTASTSNNDGENINKLTQRDYMKIMKQLQYGEYEMIAERSDGTTYFTVPYHFQVEALKPMVTVPSRMKRLAMEMSSLASSLPISHESAIFVQHDESRFDVMKVLITGPAGTPYMNGCFEFDILCPNNYPSHPIKVNFQTTGAGRVRFNPNLYNCGKVCLSLLNTWSGEQWNSQTSSILQVLVSIQGMILIPEPYFNEPGWEASRGTSHGQTLSKSYNDNLLPHTIRYAMTDQINSPSACFKKIIHTHFYLKKEEIKTQVAEWINHQSAEPLKKTLQAEAERLFSALDGLKLPA